MDAPAKINLFLQVGPAGPDGFHPVHTVMQSIEWCDHLEMELVYGEGSFEVEPPGVDGKLGRADENLAWRAWKLFAREARPGGQGLRLKLTKHIPVAAGLGGGSADAAAVLLGSNRLLGGPLSPERLSVLAARLGSDVPYFLTGGTALAEGRGERIMPLAPAPDMHVVLGQPRRSLFPPLRYTDTGTRWQALLRPGGPRGVSAGTAKRARRASCSPLSATTCREVAWP